MDLSLNDSDGSQGKRGLFVRIVAGVTLLTLFFAINIPAFSFFVGPPHPPGLIVAISVAQALTCLAVFLHPLALLAFSSDPISPGLAAYFSLVSIVAVIYLATSVASIASQLSASISFASPTTRIVSLVLMCISLLFWVLLVVLTLAQRSKRPVIPGWRRSFFRVNFVFFIFSAALAALSVAGVVLDYYSGDTGFRFSKLVFVNQSFFFDASSSSSITVMDIIISVFYVQLLCCVPYLFTIMRLSLDRRINRLDATCSVVSLLVVVCSQIVVFVCSLMYVIQRVGASTSEPPSVYLLLLVIGIVALRGVYYVFYVSCIVPKAVTGERQSLL